MFIKNISNIIFKLFITNGTNCTIERANGTIGITIGTNGITNGTIGKTLNDIGIPLVPLGNPEHTHCLGEMGMFHSGTAYNPHANTSLRPSQGFWGTGENGIYFKGTGEQRPNFEGRW